MLRFVVFLLGLAVATFISAGGARADDCQFAVGQYVDVNRGPSGNDWQAAIVLKVDQDLGCTYTVRVLMQPGDDNYDPYSPTVFEEYLRPNVLPLPYDKPLGCPYAVNDLIDDRDDNGQWLRASVVAVDDQCGLTVAPFNSANAVDPSSQHAAALSDVRVSSLAPPSVADVANAKAAQMCKGGETAAGATGTDPQSLMVHGVVADLDQRTSATNHVSFEQVQAGRASVINDGGTFATNHPDAVIGDKETPFRIVASVCTDGTAEKPPLHFNFEYVCYANAFNEGICEQTAAHQLK